MAKSFFFYDLETSGFNPRTDRIMQFGGQRTDLDLNPVGDPVNVLIKISPDTVPSPDAIMVTGITPQKTLAEGITEAEFVALFLKQIATPDTIFVGFNSIRFDDEFMRFLLYRNYVDAYEWQWKDNRSRWDLLDVVRVTRALRPEGIKWPVDSEGKPGNRLEMLTSINNLEHVGAHDALSDVRATIALAKLIKEKQPKLFDYLLTMRDKKKIAGLVDTGEPFVYTSGKYPAEFEKTTVVVKLCDHPKKQAALVYDLRHDPTPYLAMDPEQLVEAWRWKKDSDEPRLPVKTLQYNRCPAIAPTSVLDSASKKRLEVDEDVITTNKQILLEGLDEFTQRLKKALEILDKQQQTRLIQDETTVDEQLYDGFVGDADRSIMQNVRASSSEKLEATTKQFTDKRLQNLMPLYKARNYPKLLSDSERNIWDEHVKRRLGAQLPSYFKRIDELALQTGLSENKQYLLEELKLYGESILPIDVE